MRTGTGGTLVTYALSSLGNFEGYQSNVGKVGQGHYILGQCATWAIMSGNWAGLDDFRNQMEVLMANLKSPVLTAQTRGALEQFFNQTNGAVEEGAVPPFASKYKSTAPVHEMTRRDDGTYAISLKYGEGFDWRQSTLVYDLPEGWSFTRSCTYMIPYNQLSLADIFSDCQEIYESDKPQFLSLLQNHIDLDEMVPASF